MFSAVAFDLDGTLIDSTEAIVTCFMATFDDLGLPRPPREDVVGSIGHTLEDQFRFMAPDLDSDECARMYRVHYKEVACGMTHLLPGARECLTTLLERGIQVGFATSKSRKYAEMILEHHDILKLFSVRIGPDDVDNPKPHPEPLFKAARQFGVPIEKMLYVGDMAFDVKAAQAAGAPCVCVTTGYATRDELQALGCDTVYDCLYEVVAHIEARVS